MPEVGPRREAARRRILVVDDDPQLCEFVAMALAEQGYETATAEDGMTALAIAGYDPPALLLVDIGMPGLSGEELAAKVSELCAAVVPCIIMSGSVQCRTEADAGSVVAYLPKPFELDDLFRVVREHAGPPAPSQSPAAIE
ncbi:MAG TPA: response regulator [Dehalococcoidia bacterium]|nr:response regulator [Dehalococcoidia bacterium]